MSWQLAAAVFVCLYGGHLLDKHFNTRPLWLIIGFVVMSAASVLIVKRSIANVNEVTEKLLKDTKQS